MNIEQLLEIALKFRKAIELIPESKRPVGMGCFPWGACGDSSLLLGAYLQDLGTSDFLYTLGSRGDHALNTKTSHAWLQSNTCVIDITADQFPDAPSAVIVANQSHWHSTFTIDTTCTSDFRLWSGLGNDSLPAMYTRIVDLLKNGVA